MKWTEFRGIDEKGRHKEKLGAEGLKADRDPRRLAGLPALHGIPLLGRGESAADAQGFRVRGRDGGHA